MVSCTAPFRGCHARLQSSYLDEQLERWVAKVRLLVVFLQKGQPVLKVLGEIWAVAGNPTCARIQTWLAFHLGTATRARSAAD